MELDKATRRTLSCKGGAWNNAYKQALSQDAADHIKAQALVTNTKRVSEAGARIIGRLLESVQTGELTLAEAAPMIQLIK